MPPAPRPMVTLEELRRRYVTAIIRRCGGNITSAAQILWRNRSPAKR